MAKPEYQKQVFINCPFDQEFWPMMQAMVFAIHACGFIPHCALEADDAGEERAAKIMRIIEECHLGIHDLSRKGADPDSYLSRFNMPYEMGLFQGAARYGRKKKIMLVMEAEKFDYRRFISDISGRDISHHNNRPEKIISLIRDWLHTQRIYDKLSGGKKICERYEEFLKDLPLILQEAELDASETGPECRGSFINWSDAVTSWLKA